MSIEKLEELYKMIINNIILNDNNLMKYGFTKEEIVALVKENILCPTKEGRYVLVTLESFRKYGVSLLQQKNAREANMCFRKCYELAPNGRNINLQYLLALVKKRNYEEAMKVYDNLVNKSSDKYRKDDNLYLCLLSVVVECDEDKVKKVKGFTDEDIFLRGNNNNQGENQIRNAIMQGKFTYAYKLVVSKLMKSKEYSLKYELMKALLSNAIDVEKEFKTSLYECVKQENYDEVILMLEKKRKLRNLNKVENYILLITEAIVRFYNGEEFLQSGVNTTDSIYEAILGNNFELALKLNKEFLVYANENPDEDVVNILLIKINSLIEDKKKDNCSIEVDNNLEEYDDISINNSFDDVYNSEIIKNAEDIAYYISSNKMDFRTYVKKVGLLYRYKLLVKLVYARDYYIEGNYFMGDSLVNEVEQFIIQDSVVLEYLNYIKMNRNSFNNEVVSYTRRRIY